jgi:hypothetical protein
MCNAKATHSANHALPKPEADNAGGVDLKKSPVALILNCQPVISNQNPANVPENRNGSLS